MKQTIDVRIGEVRAAQGQVILQSRAIGSCVAVAFCDVKKKIGALAHIMLPGRAPSNKNSDEKNKYAANAINTLLSEIRHLGSQNGSIKVFLVGGANVLNGKDDTICEDNIDSILALLEKKNLKVTAQSLGGTDRKSISVDVGQGTIYCAEGDQSEKPMWKANRTTQ